MTQYSILDLAPISAQITAEKTFAESVRLAQGAESWGYARYWFAEHHGIGGIASTAPAVLIGHVAAHTSSIRVGAGGVMLPNHSPLVIAEQFGTLARLFPGRIDLGLGRAPGGDSAIFQALRRHPGASDRFPADVMELQRYFGPYDADMAVKAIPAYGTGVPLYILGSSLFGASLAAKLGLPYAFASHFAPAMMEEAIAYYKTHYEPSDSHPEPFIIAGFNVFAADDAATAKHLSLEVVERMARSFIRHIDRRLAKSIDRDTLLASPAGQRAQEMLSHTTCGTGPEVAAEAARYAEKHGVDELIIVTNTTDFEARYHSYGLLAENW